jgi:hypothetical protein
MPMGMAIKAARTMPWLTRTKLTQELDTHVPEYNPAVPSAAPAAHTHHACTMALGGGSAP